MHAQAGNSYKSACSIITARECGSQHLCCIAKKTEVAVHEAAMARLSGCTASASGVRW